MLLSHLCPESHENHLNQNNNELENKIVIFFSNSIQKQLLVFPPPPRFSRGLVSMGNVIGVNVSSPQNVSLSERFAAANCIGEEKNPHDSGWLSWISAACTPAPLVLLFPGPFNLCIVPQERSGGVSAGTGLDLSGWSCSRVSPCLAAGSALAQRELREARGPGGLRGR